MTESLVDSASVTAEEILGYAEEELEKALKTNDIMLYRNAVDKAFLSTIIAVNSYINEKLSVIPKSHSERRSLLRKIDREDLRALYSDVMKTLHDEAFYEGIYNPDEAKYAITLVKKILEECKKGIKGEGRT
ncbi:MAG: Archaeal PaREP1/PaREP8 family protein [Candidatus Bathyarchaeota archaeon BA1]|nr:MAG: Archaeal PaREP1/PaREP8 family protein [Candidatus Bathyarchaeota archaeon BA1]